MALVDVRFTVDIRDEEKLRRIGVNPDAEEPEYEGECLKLEAWVRDNVMDALEYAGEPEIGEAMLP